VDTDIGKRTVVETHQLGVGLMPAPPIRQRAMGIGEEIDNEHDTHLSPNMVHRTHRVFKPD
jgi:hypothetical protein